MSCTRRPHLFRGNTGHKLNSFTALLKAFEDKGAVVEERSAQVCSRTSQCFTFSNED